MRVVKMGCCNTKRPEPAELDLQTIEKHVNDDGGDDPTQACLQEAARKEVKELVLGTEESRLPLNTPTFGQVFHFEEQTFGQKV